MIDFLKYDEPKVKRYKVEGETVNLKRISIKKTTLHLAFECKVVFFFNTI